MSGEAERERRALALFEEACDLDEADLAGFLDTACGGDEELRKRVEALVRADRSPADLDGASRRAVARAEIDMAGGGEPASLPEVPGYEILEELARGGAGVVYRARDVALNRPVALKMLRAMAEPSQRSRFLKEAEVVARLRHPNIVQIHEVGEHEGRPYLALELLEGGTLAKAVSGLPQKPRRAAALVETLARTVHHAHQNGVIHRDLKPANVLLAEDGTLKIADFGVARHLDAEQGATRTGTILGTPAYMAPEQAKGQIGRIGPWTDVYALGVILYELLTGFPPFSSDSTLETVRRVADEEPRPPRRASPEVPRDLETICLKAMAKEPGRRYRSAAALADDLRRFLDLRSIEARRPGPWHRMALWCRRQPALAGTILAAVALVALVTGVSFRNIVRERDLAREANYRSLVGEARALIRAGEAGWWPEAMERLSQAAALDVPQRDPADLRSLAAEGMAVSDPYFLLESERETGSDIVSVAVAPDGSVAATGDRDGGLSLWSIPALERISRIEAHPPGKVLVAIFADVSRMASVGADGQVRFWRLATEGVEGEDPPLRPAGQETVSALALSPVGLQLLVGTEEGGVWLVSMPEPPRLLSRHEDTVRSVAFSLMGDLAASGGTDRMIRLYDVENGETIVSRNTTDPVSLISFDADGRLLFVSPANHGFGWIGPKDWEEPELLKGTHANAVTFVAREQGGRILSASVDGTVRLWSADAGEMLATTGSHSGPVRVAALAGDERVLAAHADRRLRLWRLEEHRFRLALPAGATAAFLPGESRLFLNPGSVYDLAHPLAISKRTLCHPAAVLHISPYPDGRRIALWRMNDTREVWDLQNRVLLEKSPAEMLNLGVSERVAELPGGGQARIESGKLLVMDREDLAGGTLEVKGGASCLASAPGLFAAGGESGEVRVWSIPGFEERARIEAQPGIRWLELLPAHDLIAACSGRRGTNLFSLEDPSRSVSIAASGGCTCSALTADGSRLLLGSDRGWVRAVPLEKAAGLLRGEEAARGPVRMDVFDAPVPGAHIGATWGIAVSPDGRHLATTGHDGAVKIWEMGRPGDILDLEGHEGVSWGVAFSPDGLRLASGSARPLAEGGEEGEILVRRAPDWGIEARLEGHHRLVTALAFLPKSDILVSGSLDGQLLLWDLDDPGSVPRPLRRFEETVTSLAVHPEGRYLVATGPTRSIAVWRLDRFPGRPRDVEAPPGRPWAAAFSPDGRYLAVATEQGAIGLYDGTTLEHLATLDGSQGRFRTLSFGPDNEMLAAGAWASPGVVWHLGDVRDALALAGLDWSVP